MVRALRRQQFKTLGDQHKIGDHLTKSLEDSEKLRRKYIAAKRHYEDKVKLQQVHICTYVRRCT